MALAPHPMPNPAPPAVTKIAAPAVMRRIRSVPLPGVGTCATSRVCDVLCTWFPCYRSLLGSLTSLSLAFDEGFRSVDLPEDLTLRTLFNVSTISATIKVNLPLQSFLTSVCNALPMTWARTLQGAVARGKVAARD